MTFCIQMLLNAAFWMFHVRFPFDAVAPDEALPTEEIVEELNNGTLGIIIAVAAAVIIAVIVIVCMAKKKAKEKADQQ